MKIKELICVKPIHLWNSKLGTMSTVTLPKFLSINASGEVKILNENNPFS